MSLAARLRKLAHKAGFSVKRFPALTDAELAFAWQARRLGAATILDIGANVGQTGHQLRADGWDGPIVSFEPLPQAREALLAAAARDPLWQVAPALALGPERGTAEFNVSSNLASSSFLPVLSRSTEVAPATGFVDRIEVEILPLDEALQPGWAGPFAIKIDTQGFELGVLEGASRTLENTVLVRLEMSLAKLYEGGAAFEDVYAFFLDRGWRCIGLYRGFFDPAKMEMLQVDGIFVPDRGVVQP